MPLQKVTAEEFLGKFDESIHTAIADSLLQYKSVAVVQFVNLNIGSQAGGESSALGVGPNHSTFKSVEQCEGKWLYDLPSQRQYPQCWADAEEVIQLVKQRSG